MTATAAPILTYESRPAALGRARLPALWKVLVAGYMILGRTFAYLGVPPIFIGEFFIARAIYQNHRRWIQRFIDDLFHMRLLATSVAAVILWGVFEILRTYYVGKTPILAALKTFTFNYYPLVLIIGMALGADLRVADFVRFWRRFSMLYGIGMVIWPFLRRQTLPWNEDVSLFTGPSMAAVVPVSILALWPYLRDWKWKYPALLLAMGPIFFAPGRGSLLGMAIGLVCVAFVSVHRVMVITLVMGSIFVVASIIGPMIPAAGGRGAENLDPIFGIARVVATFNEPAAARMLRDAGYPAAAEDMEVAAGTASWRKELWMGAVNSLNTFKLQMLGQGHGADLSRYTPGGEDIHTPHNFVVYAVFYTGAIGLAFFGLMMCAILMRGYFIPDRNMRAFLFSFVAMVSLMALVGNMFETPFGAIPFYLVTGVVLGINYAGSHTPTVPVMLVQPQDHPVPAPAAPRRARAASA